MTRTYLCGPINGCTDEECKDWRAYVAAILPDTCDPMVRDYRGREVECFAEIVELDKQDIDGCDFILVNYDKPSVGTSMEILYAWERKKTVITVCKEGTSISPWLRYHSTRVCHSFDEAIQYIQTSVAPAQNAISDVIAWRISYPSGKTHCFTDNAQAARDFQAMGLITTALRA